MVRNFPLLAFFAFFFVLIPAVNAQSGCCSWHKGVDYCSTSGYLMCKDGSRSPTCTCDDQGSSIFDIEYDMISQGASACPSIPAFRSMGQTMTARLKNAQQQTSNTKVGIVNKLGEEKEQALLRARRQLASQGGTHDTGGMAYLDGIAKDYDEQIAYYAQSYDIQINSIQIKVNAFSDFDAFLTKFQNDICANSNKNSSPVIQSTAPIQQFVTCNDRATISSDGVHCVCKSSFQYSSGACVCPTGGYIDGRGECNTGSSTNVVSPPRPASVPMQKGVRRTPTITVKKTGCVALPDAKIAKCLADARKKCEKQFPKGGKPFDQCYSQESAK